MSRRGNSWAASRSSSCRLVLRRALEPFAEPVRTLDALHLASVEFLRSRRLAPRLATYDRRMSTAAQAMAIPLAVL